MIYFIALKEQNMIFRSKKNVKLFFGRQKTTPVNTTEKNVPWQRWKKEDIHSEDPSQRNHAYFSHFPIPFPCLMKAHIPFLEGKDESPTRTHARWCPVAEQCQFQRLAKSFERSHGSGANLSVHPPRTVCEADCMRCLFVDKVSWNYCPPVVEHKVQLEAGEGSHFNCWVSSAVADCEQGAEGSWLVQFLEFSPQVVIPTMLTGDVNPKSPASVVAKDKYQLAKQMAEFQVFCPLC